MKKEITRRVFIASILVSGTALVLLPQGAKSSIKIEPFKIIASVQNILFPQNCNAPSASGFGAVNYLINVSSHPSFVKDDLLFLYRGARELIEYESKFLDISYKEQSNTIDRFSKTKIGRNWLSILLYYTIEALLSDPIYGGNRDRVGWRWLNHHAGVPQPKKPFGEIE
jgi:gluconate 2-dehydrogenase gamma chain